MADDINRDANEHLLKEIQRLEKEKEELQRRNRERQLLEEKLQELRGTVTSLKGADGSLHPPTSRSTNRKSPVISPVRSCRGEQAVENDELYEGGGDVEAALQESRAHIEFLQSQLRGSPSAAGSAGGQRSNVRSRDAQKTSDSSSDDEDVMSHRHKQAIQANRDILVENMIPDDIFNDLISRKILTTADVSRIKERNTREAVNEELLNNLCRRSDRAFHVFAQSLRKTLQEYLANRIDPPSRDQSRKKKRKRQRGEVNINVDCEDVEPLYSTRRGQRGAGTSRTATSPAQCTCQEVEEQILLMAKDAFRNIRRRDATPASFEQFRKELQQTNSIIKDSMEIMHTLKILCRHGDITGVSEGSVVFTVLCQSTTAARELWDMYASGALLTLLQRGFVTRTLKKRCRARQIWLKVRISDEEFQLCLHELERQEKEGSLRPVVPYSSVTKTRKRKRHEENCTYHSRLKTASASESQRPRRAFQEIGRNQKEKPEAHQEPVKVLTSKGRNPTRVKHCLVKGRSSSYNLRMLPV